MKNKKKLVDKDKILEALKKRAEGFFYSEEILEYAEEIKPKKSKSDDEDHCENEGNFKIEKQKNKNNQKNVSQINELENHDVYLAQNNSCEETFGVRNENQQALILVKKKVTTHYIPPDMSAIKMLLENFGQEVGTSVIDNMSDEELLKMRDEIVENLKETF